MKTNPTTRKPGRRRSELPGVEIVRIRWGQMTRQMRVNNPVSYGKRRTGLMAALVSR